MCEMLQVGSHYLVEYAPLVEEGGVETSVLGLQLQLMADEESSAGGHPPDGAYFHQGIVELNCTAAIGSVYWKSTSWTARQEPLVKLTENSPAAATARAAPSPPRHVYRNFLWLVVFAVAF